MELFKGLSARGRRLTLGVLVGVLGLFASACTGTNAGPQDYLSPVGPVAERADELWDLTFGIAVAIFIIVEGVLVFTLIRFRRKPGREAAQFHGNTKLEVVLTLIPALILAGLAVPTIKTIADLSERPEGAMDITVTAKQFWWEYEYPDAGVITANEMHVPTGQPIFLTLEGADVIHSFWIPKLTGKQDVVPGRTNHMQFTAPEPGTYWGQCTEYCGLSHANMRLRVIAHEPDEFQQWLEDQQQPAAVTELTGPAADGQEIFMSTCATCHAIAGTDAQARTGPDLTHFASRETFAGAMFRNNTENLTRWIDNPPLVKPGAQMPDYGLSAQQIDAVVAFLQTLE
jgi:cytochrome c oxidase subunit II